MPETLKADQAPAASRKKCCRAYLTSWCRLCSHYDLRRNYVNWNGIKRNKHFLRFSSEGIISFLFGIRPYVTSRVVARHLYEKSRSLRKLCSLLQNLAEKCLMSSVPQDCLFKKLSNINTPPFIILLNQNYEYNVSNSLVTAQQYVCMNFQTLVSIFNHSLIFKIHL